MPDLPPTSGRVVFVQPYVPAYRETFFSRLGDRLQRQGLAVDVITGPAPVTRQDAAAAFSSIEVPDRLLGWTGGRLRWRVSPLAIDRRDLVIVEQALKNVDTYPLLMRSWLGGPHVAMWGHGHTYGRARRSVPDTAKRWLTRRADWFFVYTQGGAEQLILDGYPAERITVTQNSVDTGQLRADLDAVTEAELHSAASRWSLTTGRVCLFMGRLEAEKGIDYLADMAWVLHKRNPQTTILVAGSGPQDATLKGLPNVRLLGRLDGADKALAMRSAQVLIVPRWIGLVAVESLVAELPIVTLDEAGHMPEAEYLVPEVTSVFLPAQTDPGAFAAALDELLSDRQRLWALERGCREHQPVTSLDTMVENVAEGLMAWRRRVVAGVKQG